MRSNARRLSTFPRNRLLEHEFIRAKVSELELLSAFGEPTKQTADDDTEPTFYWDLEFPCEMVMALRFEQLSEVLTVRLDEPDVVHALHHLDVKLESVATLETLNAIMYEKLTRLQERNYELWRIGNDGGDELIANALTKRDAECRLAEANRSSRERYAIRKT